MQIKTISYGDARTEWLCESATVAVLFRCDTKPLTVTQVSPEPRAMLIDHMTLRGKFLDMVRGLGDGSLPKAKYKC